MDSDDKGVLEKQNMSLPTELTSINFNHRFLIPMSIRAAVLIALHEGALAYSPGVGSRRRRGIWNFSFSKKNLLWTDQQTVRW
jgi:hypothetical protein